MSSIEQQLSIGFLTELEALKQKSMKSKDLNIVPFLEIFDAKEYIDLLLKVNFTLIFIYEKI